MRYLFLLLVFANGAVLAELPGGYWTLEQTREILDVTAQITLDPDLSGLSEAEALAVDELLAAGSVMHGLYETQMHAEAAAARAALLALHDESGQSAETQQILDIWHLSKGPIATTLDNKKVPIVPVAEAQPGKTFYPAGLSRDELDAALLAQPESAGRLLDVRHIVRHASAELVQADIERLNKHPEIEALHPGIRQRLESMPTESTRLYALPYALAYAPELARARHHLERAAQLVEDESPDFAAYLRNRSRDFLSSNYEAGDASWVSGDFDGLNIQIGSYETYDDNLRGVKASFGASILARDVDKSQQLDAAIGGLQAIENSLPYAHHKTVRSRIPVGVFNVIADFGQSRGTNTATILPNDADHTRKYGRIILLRNNIMMQPALFANRKLRFDAAVDACCRDHLTVNGGFNRTLWHEIGHYLGVEKTADGLALDAALGDVNNLIEEMKSDLVSLHAAPILRAAGHYDDDDLRAHYADGIRRTLQNVQPRPEQAYQNMQLMQFNFFLESGLISINPESRLLTVNYSLYSDVVGELLQQVLQVQYAGDYAAAKQFIERWNYWDDALHGDLASRMLATDATRRTLVRYTALPGEP